MPPASPPNPSDSEPRDSAVAGALQMAVALGPIMAIKAFLITLVGLPAMAALGVSFPWLWFDARANFGLRRFDTLMLWGGAAFGWLIVAIALRAYWRVVIQKQGGSVVPFITRLTPIILVIGVGFGVFMARGIHEQRRGHYTYFSRRLCAEHLCPPEDDFALVFEDDCEKEHAGFAACADLAWQCQKDNAAVVFEAREKAEKRCVRDRARTAGLRPHGPK